MKAGMRWYAAALVALPAWAQQPAAPLPGGVAGGTTAKAIEPATGQGAWQPLSRALEPLGTMVVGPDSLQWSICQGARPHRVAGDKRIVFALEGSPGCMLDGRLLSHLQLAPRADGCSAELSLYTSAAGLQAGEPEAWGLVERAGCR